MRLVRENINFERGLEPRKSIGIGRETLMKKIDWALNYFPAALDDSPGSPNSIKRRIDDRVKIKESQNFERGLTPKESMNIGTEARKKKLDKETDWGFEFPKSFQIKTWDIIEYEDFLIKIVQLKGSDGISYYAALNNTFPLRSNSTYYNNTPAVYDTPEEALDWEQKYIDQYNMDL